ncbi:peptidase m50 : Uncharacterized protein OS=Phaeodactylibacter xiamenensis GN=IX84_17530 PE=4 SV=1: Peptidase_M50 [Gemmata massiliana]|uniref:Peptidase M50 domain-containing protein n=1 Tax=Gemmata massiliana TaxID=1210884 RepID=A0A6P2CWQ8_9BACT|nr:M50 family metallopeptidase [Gemmata massiliana]VTR92585.1 peptidase m50 : Uncharacterized protein OS=Phaeodactylibacter xiamenensis GN=IX84_17530 PE=4 SV=1: Peptidase_M50 [Gemmata massiliana]
MFSSLKLGRLFGIDLYIHPTFWLLPLFVVMSGGGASAGELTSEVLFVFALFACVALHEFGHALAAASYGIRTRDITLYPVGGVASLEGMPEKPGQEIVVALAGPAVNVVIAVGLVLGLSAGGLGLPWERMSDPIEAFVNRLLVANVFLVLFNLLPAFPMDGGRVLRALLATQMTRLRATEVAVTVGTVVAVLFFVGGLMIPQFSLMAIAVVVWLMGQSELASLRVLAARREMERRARAFFGEPEPAPEYPGDANVDLAARRFTGIAWDTVHGVWIQWVNGVPVRALSR